MQHQLEIRDDIVEEGHLELRPYQHDLVDATRSAFMGKMRDGIDKPRVMVQLPTGGGKTAVAVQILKYCLEKYPAANVCWMTHRRELITQAIERFGDYGMDASRCRVWSVLKLWNRTKTEKKWNDFMASEGFDENSMLIVDEAHHSPARTWEGVIEKWPGMVCGFTATPWRMSKRQGIRSYLGRSGLRNTSL